MSEPLPHIIQAITDLGEAWGLKHMIREVDTSNQQVECFYFENDPAQQDAWGVMVTVYDDLNKGLCYWAQPMMRFGEGSNFSWTQGLVTPDGQYGMPVTQRWVTRNPSAINFERAAPTEGYIDRVRQTFEAKLLANQERNALAAQLQGIRSAAGADEDGKFIVGKGVGKVHLGWDTERGSHSVRLDLTLPIQDAEDMAEILELLQARAAKAKPAAPKL